MSSPRQTDTDFEYGHCFDSMCRCVQWTRGANQGLIGSPGHVLQVLADVGGKSFVGVNYCAMNKYKGPKTKEQWTTVVKNLKVGPQINERPQMSDLVLEVEYSCSSDSSSFTSANFSYVFIT